MSKRNIDRIGEINKNNFGTEMKIVEYKNNKNVTVEFQDKYKCRKICYYDSFKKGLVLNPYDRTTFGVGYFGEGKYDCKSYNDIYTCWKDMLKRGYSKEFKEKCPTYKDCFVCEEWHNFQNFAKWFEENYYECNGETMHLDKDILIKGNKIYSPETCVFIPRKINSLFVKCNKKRGRYPIGVTVYYNKNNNHKCLRVSCNIFDKNKKRTTFKYLGYFPLNRPFQAFTCYKNFKEKHIKQVADEYKDFIPKKIYKAMCKWIVEIND